MDIGMADSGTESPERQDHASLSAITSEIIENLERLSDARDRALALSRQIVRLSANAVRALHRAELETAAVLLGDARALLDQMIDATTSYPSLYWAGYVQDAMKEFAEAAITATMLADRPPPIPALLGVEHAAYLNALAEAASELRRDTLDALRENQIERALSLMSRMDDVYAVLVTVDFPDAITGGLRRSTDQLRGVLERTRGDVTVAVRQHRLEQALARVEREPGSAR